LDERRDKARHDAKAHNEGRADFLGLGFTTKSQLLKCDRTNRSDIESRQSLWRPDRFARRSSADASNACDEVRQKAFAFLYGTDGRCASKKYTSISR
jgi:hypothetical protein